MAGKQAGSVSYVPELDGMRALAVTAVLLSHYGLGEGLARLVHGLPWGLMGVWAFFVLSGFLITSILCACRARLAAGEAGVGATLGAFYARRFLRIFPIYYATLAVLWLIGDPAFRSIAGYHAVFLSNSYSAVHAGGIEANGLAHPASGHFWSLSVEEQFYALWPLFILLVPRRFVRPATAAMIVLAPLARAAVMAAGHQPAILYLPTCVDALGFGALLALARDETGRGPRVLRHRPALAAAGLVFAGGLAALVAGVGYRPVMVVFPTAAAWLFAALIDALLDGRAGAAGRVLRLAPLVRMGQISYGVYLLHTFVADAFLALLPGADALAGPLRFAVLTTATVLVCAVIWQVFERPINDLKRRVPYPGSGKRRAPEAAARADRA